MFASAQSTLFASLGAAAIYTPPGGGAVGLRAIRQGGGQPVRLGFVEVVLDRVRFDVLRSAIPSPVPGSTLALGGTTWTIQGHQPCPQDPHGLKWSLDVAWGAPVVWRSVSESGAALNPPSLQGQVTVTAAALAGESVIGLSAPYLVGRVLSGDTVTIGANVHAITAPVTAAANRLVGLSITPALAADVSAGQAVTMGFGRDTALCAAIGGYQARELQGGVVAGDVRLVVLAASAALLPDSPKVGDLVTVAGRMMTVKTATPLYAGAQVAAWEVQAR